MISLIFLFSWLLGFSELSVDANFRVADEPTVQAGSNVEHKEIRDFFESYSTYERQRNYAAIYGMLTTRYHRELERKYKVRDAESYTQFRMSSEAKWTLLALRHIQILNRDGSRAKLTADFNIEELGESEKTKVTFFLTISNKTWRIDSWKY